MRKKRYYQDYDVFNLGRGLFQAHEAEGKYWVKEPLAPGGECYSCCFRNNRPNGACTMLACHADERADGKEFVFERI